VSQLEASREMVPIRSLLQGAGSAWEHLHAGESDALLGLVQQPGIREVFVMQTRQVPACVEAMDRGPCLGRYNI